MVNILSLSSLVFQIHKQDPLFPFLQIYVSSLTSKHGTLLHLLFNWKNAC